jgi:hypothetical protein
MRSLEAIKALMSSARSRSLDAFALEHYDLIAKPTLYQICAGERDMKISTLRGLAAALEVHISDLLLK